MARAVVTPELADTIRSIRLQNKIQVKDLAQHIGKSSAYISKLESEKMQNIDTDVLYSIFRYISNTDSDNDLAEKIYSSLKIKHSKKDISDQLWYVNFDTIDRRIPIPEALIDELNLRLDTIGVSREQLLRRINANEALSDIEKNNAKLPYNQWYYDDSVEGFKTSIKLHMDSAQLDAILNKEADVSSYMYILSIAFYIIKMEQFNNKVQIDNTEYGLVYDSAVGLLNSYKFYSMAEKNVLLSTKETQSEVLEMLNSFDLDNIEIVNKIISGFKYSSECNIKDTNIKLTSFEQNMRWDLGFMMKVISLDFKSLDKTNFSNKRNLISEIEGLILKYSQLSENENRLESY